MTLNLIDTESVQHIAHARPCAEILSAMDVRQEEGLSAQEVCRRRAIFGANTLRRRKATSVFKLLLNQLAGPIVALLGIAAIIAFVYGEWREGLAIAMVLVFNTAIGFFTELRAIRSMTALRAMASSSARVRRDGKVVSVSAADIVPGDILLLEGGDVVPADTRLVSASNLTIDESPLTGESVPVDKSLEAVDDDSPVADRLCMAFKGTAVAKGAASGVVVGTGMHSELGRISKLVLEAEPERSPLERQLRRLGGQLVWVTLLVAAFIASIGVASGRDVFLMVEAAIALAVAAIPEGLPIVATMALARGMWRMAKHNALVERLSAVETLGSTTVIFTDKTGTLTDNKMTLKRFFAAGRDVQFDHDAKQFRIDDKAVELPDEAEIREILVAGVLCNTASLDRESGEASGDPLEIALLSAADAANIDRTRLLSERRLVREVAFDAEIKMMASAYNGGNSVDFYVKGAPEAVLAHASSVGSADGVSPIDAQLRKDWLEKVDAFAAQGLRVLALAKKSQADADAPAYEHLELLGIVGLYDPPRPDVKPAIMACKSAGIHIVMITGDHAVTAQNIAQSIGLAEQDALVIEGKDIKTEPHLKEQERNTLLQATVFARVTPSQKLDLVHVYQRAGEVVAMTGDGVNDAPALKKADIGIAMGLRGTQVAREAAAMVLRDDAFSTIVEAVREGRVIFRNIQRFVAYLLACNLSEVLVVGLAILVGLPLPLLPLQILFLNLITDVFPAFALATSIGDKATLDRKPREPNKPILTRSIWGLIIGNGLLITMATMTALYIAIEFLGLEGDAAVTVSFLTIAFAQLWNVFNMRDPRSPILRNDVTMNPYIWGAVVFCASILTIAIYWPAVADVLHLQPPGADAWAVIVLMSLIPLLFGQISKEISRKYAGSLPSMSEAKYD